MDGGHCPDLLHLRFQGNAPVGLLVCRNPHVTDRFCFHIFKNNWTTRAGVRISYLGTPCGWRRVCENPAGEPAEASRRRHTETQQREQRASENSPPKEGHRVRPPKPLRVLPGRLVSPLCAGHPTIRLANAPN